MITKVIEFHIVIWNYSVDLICRQCTCRMWRTPSSLPPPPSLWSTSCRCPWSKSSPLTWPRPTNMLSSTSDSWRSIYATPSLSKRRWVSHGKDFLGLWRWKTCAEKIKIHTKISIISIIDLETLDGKKEFWRYLKI